MANLEKFDVNSFRFLSREMDQEVRDRFEEKLSQQSGISNLKEALDDLIRRGESYCTSDLILESGEDEILELLKNA